MEDESGALVFEGSGGPANLASTPIEVMSQSIQDATNGCPVPGFVCGCFAGILGENEQSTAEHLIRSFAPQAEVVCFPDYAAALAAAPEGTNAVLIAGTGSVICSWNGKGTVKSGGGGPWLGDFGSAFDLGRLAVWNVSVKMPPYEPSEAFLTACNQFFGTRNIEVLPAAVSRSVSPPQSLAMLAPVIGSDTQEGFPYAEQAARTAMVRLVELVRSHCNAHVQQTDVNLAIAGGLWQAHPVFITMFMKILSEESENLDPSDRKLRQYHVVRLGQSPVSGAVALARLLFYGN